jgi:hypothetical protein
MPNIKLRTKTHHCDRAIVAMAIGLLAGCGSTLMPSQDTGLQDPMADQEQAVYAALLRTFASEASYYVFWEEIPDFSQSNEDVATVSDLVIQNLTQVSVETLASLWARNGMVHYLSADMNLGAPYVLLDSAAREAFFTADGDGWKRFYVKYPESTGIYGFSRVGFNAANDQALVNLNWRGGCLAGLGQYVLLAKSGDTWTVVQQVETWIS